MFLYTSNLDIHIPTPLSISINAHTLKFFVLNRQLLNLERF